MSVPLERRFAFLKQRHMQLVLAVFVCIAAYRFSLIDRGVFSFSDELRYGLSFSAVETLRAGDTAGLCRALSSAVGRPAYIALLTIPAYAQLALLKQGIMPDNPVSLMIPAGMNAAASLVTLLFFYALSRLFFKNRPGIALAGTIVYGLLANSNLYIRHMLGCDFAMAFFMAALYLSLRPGGNLLWCALSGLCAALTYHVNPAYYCVVPLVGLAVFFTNRPVVFLRDGGSSRLRVRKPGVVRCVCWFAAAAAVFALFILVSYKGGIDYFGNFRSISGSAARSGGTHGDFEEGFSFLPQYLIQVEGPIGVWLMVLFLAYAVGLTRRSAGQTSLSRFHEPLHLALALGCACYVSYAARAYFFHSMILMGRYMPVFFPFLVWAAVSVVNDTAAPAFRKKLLGVTLALSLVSFFFFAREYYRIAYPQDVLYKLRINSNLIVGPNAAAFSPWIGSYNSERFYCESTPWMKYYSPGTFNIRTNDPYEMKGNYILVNFCFFTPVVPESDYAPYIPPEGSRLVYSGKHFLSFPAYGFEGFTVDRRAWFTRRNYQVKVYETG